MMTITYYPHGTTTDNEQQLATGWLDGKLSARGIEQAKDLPRQALGRHYSAIYSSDLKRAVDTATIGFGHMHRPLQDRLLREINYGDLNGAPHDFKDHMVDYINNPYPNGESYHDVERRIRNFCKRVREQHDGEHIAVVGHQATQLALDVVLGGKTWEQAIAEDWRHTKSWQPGWQYTIP